MKNLYALLIAIDKYPTKLNRLEGSVNDAEAMEDFLRREVDTDRYKLHIHRLRNWWASRGRVVRHFDKAFGKAKEGDICFLYFAGHGSQALELPELSGFEPEKRMETIVCHDSRKSGGYDLADKEVSHLIRRVTHYEKGKGERKPDLHFLCVMDCCHSGNNVRDEVFVRRIEGSRVPPLEDFIGFELFTEEKEWLPGASTNFSATETMEYLEVPVPTEAYAYALDGEHTRGLFTYSLLEVLTGSPQLSYKELEYRVRQRVQALIEEKLPRSGNRRQQRPTVSGGGDEVLNSMKFLNGALRGSGASSSW
jgi:hypothetical protein